MKVWVKPAFLHSLNGLSSYEEDRTYWYRS